MTIYIVNSGGRCVCPAGELESFTQRYLCDVLEAQLTASQLVVILQEVFTLMGYVVFIHPQCEGKNVLFLESRDQVENAVLVVDTDDEPMDLSSFKVIQQVMHQCQVNRCYVYSCDGYTDDVEGIRLFFSERYRFWEAVDLARLLTEYYAKLPNTIRKMIKLKGVLLPIDCEDFIDENETL